MKFIVIENHRTEYPNPLVLVEKDEKNIVFCLFKRKNNIILAVSLESRFVQVSKGNF